MKNTILKPIFDTLRYWYIPLLVGVLFIVAGIFAFASPAVSFLSLAVLFSLSLLFSGISEVIFSVSNRKSLDNWGWYLTLGIFTLVVGILLLADPQLSTNVLALYIGFTFLFRSIATISLSMDIKNYGAKDWGYLLTLGIIGILASVILLVNPAVAGLSAVILMGMTFMIIGIYSVIFSFQLRKGYRYAKKVKPELKDRFQKMKEEMINQIKESFYED